MLSRAEKSASLCFGIGMLARQSFSGLALKSENLTVIEISYTYGACKLVSSLHMSRSSPCYVLVTWLFIFVAWFNIPSGLR